MNIAYSGIVSIWRNWTVAYVPGFLSFNVLTRRTTLSYESKNVPNLSSRALCLALQAFPYLMLVFHLALTVLWMCFATMSFFSTISLNNRRAMRVEVRFG